MDKDLNGPLISIIMPAFNAGKFICDSIASVCAQIFQNWELIVIDDGSTDDTASIVKDFQKQDRRIQYVFQENMGLGAARNAGLALALGTWIAFLDSDDLWMKNKLQIQADLAQKQQADIFFSKGFYLDNASNTLLPYEAPAGEYDNQQMYTKLMLHNCIPVLSVMLSKKLAEQLGPQGIHPFIRGCEDLDYWLRACKIGARFYGIDDFLFKYRLHGQNMSANQVNMQRALAYVLTAHYDQSMLEAGCTESVRNILTDIWVFLIIHYRSVEKKLRAPFVQLLSRMFLMIGGLFLVKYVITKKLRRLLTPADGTEEIYFL